MEFVIIVIPLTVTLAWCVFHMVRWFYEPILPVSRALVLYVEPAVVEGEAVEDEHRVEHKPIKLRRV